MNPVHGRNRPFGESIINFGDLYNPHDPEIEFHPLLVFRRIDQNGLALGSKNTREARADAQMQAADIGDSCNAVLPGAFVHSLQGKRFRDPEDIRSRPWPDAALTV